MLEVTLCLSRNFVLPFKIFWLMDGSLYAFWHLYSRSDEVKGEQEVNFFPFSEYFFVSYLAYMQLILSLFLFFIFEKMPWLLCIWSYFQPLLHFGGKILVEDFDLRVWFWWCNPVHFVFNLLLRFCFTEFELELELEINLMFLLSVDWYNLYFIL